MLENITIILGILLTAAYCLALAHEVHQINKKIDVNQDQAHGLNNDAEPVVIPEQIKPKLCGKQFYNHRKHALRLAQYSGNKVYFGVHRNAKGQLSTFFIEVEPNQKVLTKGIVTCIMVTNHQ